jgi:hypothetical protein
LTWKKLLLETARTDYVKPIRGLHRTERAQLFCSESEVTSTTSGLKEENKNTSTHEIKIKCVKFLMDENF